MANESSNGKCTQSESQRKRLADLSASAWELFRAAYSKPPQIVSGSIPILYFGNGAKFFSSQQRVITLGLNPSDKEFESQRFLGVTSGEGFLLEAMPEDFCRRYLRALDNYFKEDPYRRWFGSFAPILRGMGCTYYDDPVPRDRVLHTDLCSPLATVLPWGKIPEAERADLERDGVPLWHELVKLLRPQLILTSVGREHLESKVQFQVVQDWALFQTPPLAIGHYDVWWRIVGIDPAHRAHLIYGPGKRGTPFAGLTSEDRRRLGMLFRDKLLLAPGAAA